MIYTSPTVRLVNHYFTTRTSRATRTGRTVELKCSFTNDMHVTIDPRPVQPVNHCFTTCTGRTSRTSRVKPFTGRIRSTVLDKDVFSRLIVESFTTSREVSKSDLGWCNQTEGGPKNTHSSRQIVFSGFFRGTLRK